MCSFFLSHLHLQYLVNSCRIWLSNIVCLHVPTEGVIYSVPSISVAYDCQMLFVWSHVPMEESIRSILSICVVSDCQMLFVLSVLLGCYLHYSVNLHCIWLSNVVLSSCSYRECHLQYSVNPVVYDCPMFFVFMQRVSSIVFCMSIPVVSDCPVLFVFMFLWISVTYSVPSISVVYDFQMLFVFMLSSYTPTGHSRES